jgi:hypothetical protein
MPKHGEQNEAMKFYHGSRPNPEVEKNYKPGIPIMVK